MIEATSITLALIYSLRGNFGALIVRDACESDISTPQFCEIIDHVTVRNIIIDQPMTLPAPSEDLILPPILTVSNGPLKLWDSFNRRLYYCVQLVLNRIDYHLSQVLNGIFDAPYHSILALVPENDRNSVTHTCREIARTMAAEGRTASPKWHPVIFAVAMAFAGPHDVSRLSRWLVQFKYGPSRIDMSGSDGIFTYNDLTHKYFISGVAVTRRSQPRHNLSWALDGLLSGYKISIEHDPSLRTLSTAMLNKRADHIEDGEEYNTILAGKLIKATRDRSLNHLRP